MNPGTRARRTTLSTASMRPVKLEDGTTSTCSALTTVTAGGGGWTVEAGASWSQAARAITPDAAARTAARQRAANPRHFSPNARLTIPPPSHSGPNVESAQARRHHGVRHLV